MAEEKRFEKKIRAYLDSIGAWHLKTISNGYQRAGTPDLIICFKGHFIAVEVKAVDGKATPLQMYTLKKISSAGGTAILLFPDEFDEFKAFMEDLR